MKRMIRHWSWVFVFVAIVAPEVAFAQAAITGMVKDTSGAVLPGVTVEAASPVLIEKVRSAVSDGTGQYRIVALPPGTYSLTFALPGFSTVKREGIELSGTFVATVNGDLKVGGVEETITVTAETPIVDVQSARVQQTVSKDILAAIPSSRTAAGLQALIPGMTTTSDSGGAAGGSGLTAGAIHGGRTTDSRVLSDGLTTGWNNGASGYNTVVNGAQEVVITTSGGLGEAEQGGVMVNVIPRDGANTFSGTMFFSGANSSMQGSNYTQELQNQGLKSPQKILKVYQINPMGGGRIIRDKLWFYNTLNIQGAQNTIPGMYWNRNAGDPTKWTYEPDLSRPAATNPETGTAMARLTWQVTPRNKVTIHWAEGWISGGSKFFGGSATASPETDGVTRYPRSRVQQATWSAPVTNRVLLEAAFGISDARYQMLAGKREEPVNNPLLDCPTLSAGSCQAGIQVLEQAGPIPNLLYRFQLRNNASGGVGPFLFNTLGTHTWRASVSFVSGAHNVKVGYFGGFFNPEQQNSWNNSDGIMQYRFRDGVPNQILFRVGDATKHVKLNRWAVTTAIYAQDQWTISRLTLQGGVRFDHFVTMYPDQQAGGDQYVPVPIAFPAGSVPGVHWSDITPRMGAVYDLFGNGRTALKVNLGKYPTGVQVQDPDFDMNPLARVPLVTTRSWADANRNYVPDCDLTNQAQNGECGAGADRNFGKNVFSQNFDTNLVNGWGKRLYDWELGASVQQQVAPRVSVTAGYYRRWFGNFYVTENRLVGPSDYDPFSITVTDPRLPGGASTFTGVDLNPQKFGQLDAYRTTANTFGQQIEYWHGVDFGVTARMRSGLAVQGGTSTGRRVTDTCALVAQLPEFALYVLNTIGATNAVSTVQQQASYCHQAEPFFKLTQIRGLATYTIPRADVQVSGTWQSNPGPNLLANYNAPNPLVSPSLGRSLSGGAATAPIGLIKPATLYGARINQVDMRFSKNLKFGRTRTNVGVDVYNVTNTAVPLTYNNTFIPGSTTWLTPLSILAARWAKFSAQFDF